MLERRIGENGIMLVKLLNEYAQLPTRGTIDSAGLDIYCPFNITVHADSQKRIPLGIAVEIPKGYVGVLAPRSSLCKTPLRVPNLSLIHISEPTRP